MDDRGWRAFEQRLAKRFGTTRIPAAGWGAGKQLEAPDFETPTMAVQVKKGYSPPAYLADWLEGIVKQAEARGKVGLVIWAGKRVRDDEALVFMRLADLLQLVERPQTYVPGYSSRVRPGDNGPGSPAA